MDNVIEKTAEFARNYFKGDASGHDWWHTYRVWNIAKKLQAKEGGDQFVIEMAALLHDVDDYKISTGENNALKWLEKNHISEDKIGQIISVIDSVSFKGSDVDTTPESIEGMIVQDADRLDAIGAIGIARTFSWGGSHERQMYNPEKKPQRHNTFDEYKKGGQTTINHFYEKLLLVLGSLCTSTARKCAESRHAILEEFLSDFHAEWNADDIEI